MTYGLGLSQRELQEFAGVDMGNIYHDALWHLRSASAGLRIPGTICPNRRVRRGLRRA